MNIVQFEIPGEGRRVGIVNGGHVVDVTSGDSQLRFVADVFAVAQRAGRSLADFLIEAAAKDSLRSFSLDEFLAARPGGSEPFLHPPLDHADPHRVLVSGTGLTHTGGMKSRDQMHKEGSDDDASGVDAPVEGPQTDSARMFAMGLAGGKPAAGQRGAGPEWFYKGNGSVLRGPNDSLLIPDFTEDGGEEPELAGLYIIGEDGQPYRLGFTLGNEWSDHAVERVNYLYLAPSKLRTCAIGPELNTDFAFDSLDLRCSVSRNGETIYDSGPLLSGEENMCHSLANCEDHHFKYPQHRRPGDVHVHFFGTSRLSHTTRDWKYQPGDEIHIEASTFSSPLVNVVAAGNDESLSPVVVRQA
ncbi:MAG: GguC family protein [Planctomycetota bacterium]|nr:GguC family protein [Planctomycetota bacterium]